MAKVPVAVRLTPELVEWADEYARERTLVAREAGELAKGEKISRQQVLESAVEAFRDDCLAGVPELRAAVRRQSSVRGEDEGVGVCPNRSGELGHVWESWKVDPAKPCRFCGLSGRAFFHAASAERTDVFSRLVASPVLTGKPLSAEQEALAARIVEDKRRRDRDAVESGVARPGQVTGARAAKKGSGGS